MKFKSFTQAYLLIKNNPTYTKSLGNRGQTVLFWGSILAIWFSNNIKGKLPANEKVWSNINNTYHIITIDN